ncbi:MAG: dTMP kinase [Prevotellaceae bacterium]|jgi:dTMP kinase|nr:dTMP kinase [Prevotellaceae bacterium]
MNFIAIEGLDGAGKSTQVELLKNHLEAQKRKTKYIHFPKLNEGIFGELVAKFLRGDLGKNDEVNPYLVALIFAEDRRASAKMLESWLSEDYFLIVDRYVYSNIAFQCTKVNDEGERRKLREWITHLEFEYFDIPKPQQSIFLDVPFAFTRQKLTSERMGASRDYLEGKQDIHEADLDFQQRVREMYLEQSKYDEDFKIINCGDEQGNMLPPAETFSKIRTVLAL